MQEKMDRYSRDRNQIALENSVYCLCLFKDMADRYYHADSWLVSGNKIRRKAHHTAPWDTIKRIRDTLNVAKNIEAREIEYSYGDAILRRAAQMTTIERVHLTMTLRKLLDELVKIMAVETHRDDFEDEGKYYLFHALEGQAPSDTYQLILEKLHGVTDYGRKRKDSE